MEGTILRYEELAMNAFPAIATEVLDGWILRYSNGYTYRGNSVNPLYKSTLDLNHKLAICEEKFSKRGLPCVFKMTKQVEDGLDEILAERGYTVEKAANIMELLIDEGKECKLEAVSCSDFAEKEWMEQFLRLNGTIEEPARSTAAEIILHIGNPIVCASIIEEGQAVACGLGVYEDGKIGLYDIRVDEQHRRKGYGTMICKKIIQEGRKLGAKRAYLQVASLNEIAISMYQKMGFETAYTYWYRVLEKAQTPI